MCDVIPPEWLPPRAEAPPVPERSRFGRRTAVLGLGAAVLGACMPVRTRGRPREPFRATPEGRVVPPRPRPAPPPYRIVRRAAWGAEPLKDNHDPMARVTRITVHHTAELPGMDSRTDLELVKGVQDFHRNGRGWADIGYHWLVGRDGNVYEGRALDVQGAHAGGGNNQENLGISVIGDFREALPAPTMLRTLELFLRAQMKRYEIGAEQVFGHRDFKPTACPGDALYGWLGRFKAT